MAPNSSALSPLDDALYRLPYARFKSTTFLLFRQDFLYYQQRSTYTPFISLPLPLQQLQMTSNLINQALGRGANTQHSPRPRGNLCTASILNNLGSNAQAARLAHQLQHLVLGLGLHGDLGLAVALPLTEQAGRQRLGLELGGREEAFVAGEGGVGALGCDFTCFQTTTLVTRGRGICRSVGGEKRQKDTYP